MVSKTVPAHSLCSFIKRLLDWVLYSPMIQSNWRRDSRCEKCWDTFGLLYLIV